MDILNQLGDLVLGSVPTMILFLALIVLYDLLVRRPLEKTLLERKARTSGAVEQARGAIAAAEAETSVYEDKLRAAKAEIFALREQRLAAWQAERDTALGEVRATAERQLQAAKDAIEASSGQARAQVESASGDLASRILAALLPAGASRQEAAQ